MNAQGQKTGGRQKGTPNKITAEIREFLATLVFDNMDLIRQDVRNMTPEQRASFLPKILPYIAPKMKPQIDDENDKQERKALQLQEYRQHAEQIFNWMEQNQQEQQPQDNTTSNPADAHEQQDCVSTNKVADQHGIGPEHDDINSTSESNDITTSANITDEDLTHLKQKLHNLLRQEFKRRFQQNFEESQNTEPQQNTEPPQNSEDSPNTNQSAPSPRTEAHPHWGCGRPRPHN